MKVVYDTCLYIDLLRKSKYLDIFTERSHIRFLSPIVLMELKAGARTDRQRKGIDRLIHPYSQANRVIHLDANIYYKAGESLARLKLSRQEIKRGLTHDVLIALSARSIGATLYTSNSKDFKAISKVLSFKAEYLC